MKLARDASDAAMLAGLVPSCMKVLGARVDALTLAFRVTLDPSFTEALRRRGSIAYRHGRAAFFWRNRVPRGMNPSGDRNGPVALGGLRARWSPEAGGPAEDHEFVSWGELRYSRTARCWNVTNQPYFQLRIDEQAPGASDSVHPITRELVREGGWTIEIKFYAQWLADVGLHAALAEARAMASLCGEVHEQRLRRIDLCADVQGWEIGEEDVNHLVKRPRARWQKEYGGVLAVDANGEEKLLRKRKSGKPSKAEREEEIRAQDFGRGALSKRQITGLSVGRGGAMMTRIYDKRVELERDEERRVNEEARWMHAGWDGRSRVTRIEFQIRGTVIAEFGLRDPSRVKDVEWGTRDGRVVVVAQKDAVRIDEFGEVHHLGLVDRLDAIWQSCLDWVRLVELSYTETGNLHRSTELADDARWALLRDVKFTCALAPSVIKRFRVRTVASAAMMLGVAVSRAARDGKLVLLDEAASEALVDEDAASRELAAYMSALMIEQTWSVIEDLCRRFGGPIGAWEHVAIRNNASVARWRERQLIAGTIAARPPPVDVPPPSGVRWPEDDDDDLERPAWVA